MEQAQFYGGLRSLGKKNLEWNLNDWQWDGDLFVASPQVPASAQSGFRGQQVVPVPVAGQSSNSSSSISDDLRAEPEIARWQARDLDRKRRVIAVDNDNDGEDESGSLSLKLGGFSSSGGQSQVGIEVNVDGSGGKKTKLTGSPPNRSVCQVENCGVDLSSAKDYHRRHKVCEMHSKASRALVGNVMQRFCQQCSRFHHLQEFDEGKRSCRRRLAGHNKRRRKTLPEPVVGSQPVNNEQASNYILASLLKSLSNVHTDNRTDPSTDHDLVARLVRSLASQPGPQNVNDVSGMLHEYQRKFLNGTISVGNSEKVSQPSAPPSRPPKPTDQCHSMPASVMPQERQASSQKSDIVLSKDGLPVFSEVRNSAEAQTKFNFDLNDVYVDLEDGVEDPERSPVTVTGAFRTGSLDCPSWAQQDSQQSSPPHVSGNSDSASAHSLSSSSGEAQSQSGRIVFKLFGKEPNDFPVMLRGQILDWLAHSPTDLESYIRPGCVILTIYLRLREPLWEELCSNFGFSLSRLLDITDDSFWGTGWLYARVQNQIAFCHNGQLVINTSLPSEIRYCSRILSVSPIAVSMSELAQFQIKGFNLSRPSTRLICALDGKYLALEETHLDLTADDDNSMDNDEIKCVNLSCFIPSVAGRGFIEVEDDGLTSSFFPFIVAENDVCSEIRTLESLLESGDSNEANKKLDAKHQAMDFLHEMGWLLHRCQLKSRLTNQNLNTSAFSFKRFTCILEFSMDHDWCAVVKKLLDIFLQGMVDAGEHPSQDVAISAMGLLHRAVRRNSRSLVELLLHYSPLKLSEEFGCEQKLPSGEDGQNFLFRPDAKGPGGLTPLHIAAGKDGSEAVLEALIDDPGKVGLEAWKNARDSTGSTPEDYARLRGHYAYIHLVQRKMSRQPSTGSVVVDMPNDINSPNTSKRTTDGISGFELAMLASRNVGPSCNRCERKMAYGSVGRSLVYRPVMLSMVGIAAVCVCVALLFRGLPDVDCIFRPFRWESLDYGSI